MLAAAHTTAHAARSAAHAQTGVHASALVRRAAPPPSSQDEVKKQRKTGKELRLMLVPVPDGGTPEPGAAAFVEIMTMSERANLRNDGDLGQIALNAISPGLLQPAQLREDDEVRAATLIASKYSNYLECCTRPLHSSFGKLTIIL